MTVLSSIKRVYLIGIGGIGMSALARYFAFKGCIVCGYDKTRTALCEKLESEGMLIRYLDDESSLPVCFLESDKETLIIYTPAIPKHSAILNHFRSNGFKLCKRSEVLGMISHDSFCIAVAGTHGKTTTSAMIAHILTDTGYGCNAFLGGILTNYNSNFLVGHNNVVVVEADEYDRSFLTLHPDIAVITSMDADHLDIYGDGANLEEAFTLFARQVKEGGTLIRQADLPLVNGDTYSLAGQSMYRSDNVQVDGSAFVFDFVSPAHTIESIRLRLPGNHNVENAVAAIAVALSLGIEAGKVKTAVENFKGVKRRFEIILEQQDHILIDDYAHHPQELRACFQAVRMLFPEKKMTVVFQPHLYSRTKDFADEFAAVLATADKLLLMEIYPAREQPIEGIDAEFLLRKIDNPEAEICGKETVKSRIKALDPELLLFVGAGDIDTMVQPAKKILENVE